MKKLVLPLMIVALLVGLFAATVYADPVTAKLMAGQTMQAGNVFVTQPTAGDTLRVAFVTSGGWCMTQTHLHVADALEDIPQNSQGNPQVGHFAYGDSYDPCVNGAVYYVPLDEWSTGDVLYIAAHAVVTGPGGQQTAWGAFCGDVQGANFPGNNWAAYFIYTVQ